MRAVAAADGPSRACDPEDLRVLEEAFGPNLPQVLRKLVDSRRDGAVILGCRVVDEVPRDATPSTL